MLIEESYRIANIALGWTNNAKTSDITKQASNILEFTEEKVCHVIEDLENFISHRLENKYIPHR